VLLRVKIRRVLTYKKAKNIFIYSIAKHLTVKKCYDIILLVKVGLLQNTVTFTNKKVANRYKTIS